MTISPALLMPLALQAAEAAPIVPGTVAVEQPVATGKGPPPELPFAEALGDALAQAGFTQIGGIDNARYAARFEVRRVAKGAVVAKGSNGGAVAGPAMMGGSMSGGIAVGLGKSTQVGQLVETMLIVRLVRRGESAPAWEGRAVTQQVGGSRGDVPAALAAKLAGALFRNFPQPTGLSISVP